MQNIKKYSIDTLGLVMLGYGVINCVTCNINYICLPIAIIGYIILSNNNQ